jgi:hypothetical protein
MRSWRCFLSSFSWRPSLAGWRFPVCRSRAIGLRVKLIWNILVQPLFLHSFLEGRLPDSIMAVQLILVQFVEVRILVGQQVAPRESEGFCFLRTRSELARESGRKNKTSPASAGRGHLGNANAGRRIERSSEEKRGTKLRQCSSTKFADEGCGRSPTEGR